MTFLTVEEQHVTENSFANLATARKLLQVTGNDAFEALRIFDLGRIAVEQAYQDYEASKAAAAKASLEAQADEDLRTRISGALQQAETVTGTTLDGEPFKAFFEEVLFQMFKRQGREN